MTPTQIRILIYALLLGLAVALGFIWLKSRDAERDLKSDVEQSDRTASATTGIVTDTAAAREVIHRTEVIVRDNRDTYQRDYEDAKRDPSVADFAATPIPVRLRELARARREARERSGSPRDGSRDPAATP